MSLVKTRISVTIIPQLAKIVDEIAKNKNMSKSAVVEYALKSMVEDRLTNDLKKLSKLEFDDLPNEDEWLHIQQIN